ncbi:MAG: hypothetical protein EB150_04400 [Nitrososphaeria archaeon]|nr:hypothetical protein [Nitrososphaeria archaeon]
MNFKNIYAFLMAGILLLGIVPTTSIAFADPGHTHDDNEDHDGGYQKDVNHVWTGDGKPSYNLGKTNDLYIDNASPNHTVYEKTSKKTWTAKGDYLSTRSSRS